MHLHIENDVIGLLQFLISQRCLYGACLFKNQFQTFICEFCIWSQELKKDVPKIKELREMETLGKCNRKWKVSRRNTKLPLKIIN